MFVSTSLDRAQVEPFRKNYGVIVRVDIPRGCANACCIADKSKYGHEKEVLIPPYSPFQVVTIDLEAREIHARLLDGMDVWEREKATGKHSRALPL